MTRAEPVALVKQTIQSLLAIKEYGDEILIIDNNHTNKLLYKPLQHYCNGLDADLKVRFYHHDYIAGYKAGALNLALQIMDTNCDYIVVVDSDYQALPWARGSIANAVKRYPDHALLQFPQFYRDYDKVDIHAELNHYFSHHLNQPNNHRQALSTGTYAVIKRTALLRVGGWSSDSITEDAQMGVLMHLQGEQTQYIPEVIATGVLPQTMTDLTAQRRRWIYGNMQVLTSYPKLLLTHYMQSASSVNAVSDQNTKPQPVKRRSLLKTIVQLGQKLRYKSVQPSMQATPYTDAVTDIKRIRAHFSQLSAWVNFTGGFILLQGGCVALLLASQVIDAPVLMQTATALLPYCYLSYGVFMGRRLYAYLCDQQPLTVSHASPLKNEVINSISQSSVFERIRAWQVHLNFWEMGALSWLPVIWGQEKPFVCTPKVVTRPSNNGSANHLFKMAISDNKRATLASLPKSLLVLNMATAVLVLQHSPLLFACALVVVVVKLASAWVVMRNFAEGKAVAKQKVEADHLQKMSSESSVSSRPAGVSNSVVRSIDDSYNINIDNPDEQGTQPSCANSEIIFRYSDQSLPMPKRCS